MRDELRKPRASPRQPTPDAREADLDRGPARSIRSRARGDGPDPAHARRSRASAGEGQTALIGGVTAENHDNREALAATRKLIVPLVLALILLVLIALLRCVVAPLYLIGTVILSFAFALGGRR